MAENDPEQYDVPAAASEKRVLEYCAPSVDQGLPKKLRGCGEIQVTVANLMMFAVMALVFVEDTCDLECTFFWFTMLLASMVYGLSGLVRLVVTLGVELPDKRRLATFGGLCIYVWLFFLLWSRLVIPAP